MSTLARGQDVSGLYQDPRLMRYSDWAGLGFCFGFYEVAIGIHRIPWAAEHRAGMRAGGYLTGPYLALSEMVTPQAQCRLLLAERMPDDELPNMLDVERRGLSEAWLRGFCDEYDATTSRELLIYTGKSAWEGIVPLGKRSRYAQYGLMIAGYPFDAAGPNPPPMDDASVALRSNPPVTRKPAIPGPWASHWSWQYTGHGRLPGYGNDLDLQVSALSEAALRAKYGGAVVQQPEPDLAAIAGHAAAIVGLVG